MKTYRIPQTDLHTGRIAYGCMRLAGSEDEITLEAQSLATAAIEAAVGTGMNLFDHADLYYRGRSEEIFGRILKDQPGLREQVIVQSKCGIRGPSDILSSGEPNRFDFSYEHIIRATEGILQRLDLGHLDILLLHRPDPLCEPAEVARAFDDLQTSGKVRHFGVSNHTVGQIDLLRRYVRQPIVINQLQFSLLQPALVVEGFRANQSAPNPGLGGGLLDYCQLHDILVQPWSPVEGGAALDPKSPKDAPLQDTADLLQKLALAKNVSPEAILLTWILRHPAGMQPIIGTTKPDRIVKSAQADEITLTREEWYSLLAAARGQRVP